MKLDYLHLNAVKQFRQPLKLDDLTDGINLFVGPNESGKSTLVDALRAAFFERSKSKSVDYLQPWGDSSAAPEVELAFDWQGRRWQLNKRFLHQPRCDLTIDHEHLGDTDAEDKLAALFGYQFAGKGASRPDVQGIPGLLWVQQGTIQDIHDPVAHAADQLQAALGNSLGNVASSAGDELVAAVQNQCAQWLTPTGKPRGDYKASIETCDAGQAALEELAQRVQTYRDLVDELGRLREQRRTIDQSEPWQHERERAAQAQQQLADVGKLQSAQQQDQAKLQDYAQQQAMYRQQLQDFDNADKQLAKRTKTREKAQAQLTDYQSREPQVAQKLAEAQAAFDAAKKSVAQARQQASRVRLQTEHDTLAASLSADRKTLEQARQIQTQLADWRAQLGACAIDAKAVAKLKRLRDQLDKLQIQRDALATRVRFDLLPDKVITVGDIHLAGQGEYLLREAATLAIAEVGTLTVEPGGKDVAKLAREQDTTQGKYEALLGELGVADVAASEDRLAANKELVGQIERESARLEGLAPQGVDALAAQCEAATQRLSELAARLAALPAAQPNAPDEAEAETTLETAQARLDAAEQTNRLLVSDLAMAQQAFAAAEQEWQTLKTDLESPDYQTRRQQARTQLTDLKALADTLQAAVTARQTQIDAAQPEALAQDVERHTRSAQAMEDEATQRHQAIIRLEATLETQGAQGLDEQLALAQQEQTANERRRDELVRRTRALSLLQTLLAEARQTLTRQLQAPLRKHLDHYLALLFAQASLDVDEGLAPSRLTRSAANGQGDSRVDELSYGTREQMGLISRLAYADLLQEAGQPTLIILDDALVHSDATRLAQMKRILFDAASRHQILLFSCHPDNWRDVGVAARDLKTLKAAAA